MDTAQSLASRVEDTNPQAPADAACPVETLGLDLERLHAEILALYKAKLPAAIIHQIARGAHEQAEIGRMMLDDCRHRSANGTLNDTHLANARRWIGGVRRFMENRQTTYGVSIRRKFYVIRPAR
jgi:hypothetical protein